MHLTGSKMSVLGIALMALFVGHVTAQARNFTVPMLQTHEDNRRGPDYTPDNTTILFRLTDVHANQSTSCATSFYPPTANLTSYPTHRCPAYCTDHHFGWYFSTFTNIANFSINVVHSYVDKKVGPRPIRLYGTGPLISPDTVPGLSCRSSSGGSDSCGFANDTNPIVIPVTGMVGRRGGELGG